MVEVQGMLKANRAAVQNTPMTVPEMILHLEQEGYTVHRTSQAHSRR